jgi:hypothetical protein
MQAQNRWRSGLVLLSPKVGARWRWVVNAMPQPLYPQERALVPSVGEAGWAPGSVWKNMEKRKHVFPQGFAPRALQPICSRCSGHQYGLQGQQRTHADSYCWLNPGSVGRRCKTLFCADFPVIARFCMKLWTDERGNYQVPACVTSGFRRGVKRGRRSSGMLHNLDW